MTNTVTNIDPQRELEAITEYWKPRVIGRVNNQFIKIAKLKGEFVWHAHEHEDEMFSVIYGTLRIQLEDRTIVLNAGEFCVIPKQVQHKPIAEEECAVMLIETDTTLHTGGERSSRTVSIEEQLYPR
ncbi:cupin domain-containing protein [Pseudomonas guariconensis]|uniref:cupin domain-containing protein n=1 Tax=Pseudomonas TaxID=286 RepID=UPI001CE46AB7|nr:MULTISPECIES: cupin domain-containing protein [Pseudomonas]MCO7640671.1 cupin domain-containing protein [Pseudomonas sp. S 311-6]MCO7515791.1 cupin domain-containing protein [Pseudomonas putida]MCO7566365.1 cupin domain-containing protein [Pseudomonas mosselii]MCO7597395.1 cupin domain-containing protein [Pseudomonas guariconensis]MCO7605617.1 cupin domain-containing protein [Pseudomonas guariconensis]